MTLINPITGKEYQNTFDPAKRYEDILFNGGVNLQSRELAEIVSLLAHRVKRIGNTLYNDGSLVKGGVIVVNNTAIKIESADVFIAGVVYAIPTTDLTITKNGTEIIGVKLTSQITTYQDDSTLLDPAPGPNKGRPGADRLKITPQWVINDPDAYPIFTFIDGNLQKEIFAPQADPYAAWMARRTNDESGSYTVSGLTGYVTNKDTNNYELVVEAGKAYVQGWEISKPTPVKTTFAKSLTVRTVMNETKIFTLGMTESPINSTPVKQVTRLTAQVEKTITMTRGQLTNSKDLIPFSPVSEIISISGFTKDTDYVLNGDYVDWGLTGIEPPPGSTYTITFVYTKVCIANTDYQLYENKIKWLDGDKPGTGRSFSYDYEFYLSRRDLFYITKDGDIGITLGEPAINPPLPPRPVGVLVLGDIEVPPAATTAVVNNYDPKRLTMEEIRNFKVRMDNWEYNMVVEDLDNVADKMDPATAKRGIFTDGFYNLNKMDEEVSNCSVNVASGTLMSAFSTITKDLNTVSSHTNGKVHNRLVTKNYSEVVGLQQDKATNLMNINPYMVYNKSATISLTPNQDSWIETSTITTTVYRWFDDWTGNGWGTDVQTSTTTQVILDEEVPFIRVRDIEIYCRNFLPNSDNVKCSFDGILVTLTPLTGYSAGTLADTMKANASGEFKAKFTIPSHVPCGTREIVVWND